MIPLGYMAKRICSKPEFLNAPAVVDIYSVSSCVNDDFADYIRFWRHNGFWLFDSPEIILAIAQENSIDVQGMSLFYYEAHEMEFDGRSWRHFGPESSIPTHVAVPSKMELKGFDVVTFCAGNAPECSPLSCNGLAEVLRTNQHCLLDSFEDAKSNLEEWRFSGAEPGPCRILAVYSVAWPRSLTA
jgi:hypothetical protein